MTAAYLFLLPSTAVFIFSSHLSLHCCQIHGVVKALSTQTSSSKLSYPSTSRGCLQRPITALSLQHSDDLEKPVGKSTDLFNITWPHELNVSKLLNETQINLTNFFIQTFSFPFGPECRDESHFRLRKRDLIRSILRKAAALSLQDYEWRSSYFRATEAERRIEESLARLMGDEYPTYIRPGDAPEQKIGPLVGFNSIHLFYWIMKCVCVCFFRIHVPFFSFSPLFQTCRGRLKSN